MGKYKLIMGKILILKICFSAFKYALLNTPEPWDPQGTPPEPEPEDEVKIRNKYLPIDYHDDHFDLTEKEKVKFYQIL